MVRSLEVGLAEIGAEQRVVGVEADGELDVAPPPLQVAAADGGEAEAEARPRIGGVELDRPPERLLRLADVDRGERGEAEHGLHPLQLGGELARLLRRLQRPAAIALHQPQFRQPRPGERVLRLVLHRLLHRVARRLDPEPRLLGIGERDPRRRRARAELDAAPGVGERPIPLVLRHRDHRAQRVRAAVGRIAGERLVDVGARLFDPPDRQQRRRPVEIELRSALGFRNTVEPREGGGELAAAGELDRLAERTRDLARRHPRAVGERQENDRIEERPLHRVARPHQHVGRRRLPGLGHQRLAARNRQLALIVARRDPAVEHGEQRPLRLDPDQELGALDGGVEERRIDLEDPRLAAEEVDGALDQADHRRLVLRHVGQAQRRVLIDALRQIGDGRQGAAAIADADQVARAQRLVERGGAPVHRPALDLDLALDRSHVARRRKAAVRRPRRRRSQHRHGGDHECGEEQPDTHPPSLVLPPPRLFALSVSRKAGAPAPLRWRKETTRLASIRTS